jgi:hypothetical protein
MTQKPHLCATWGETGHVQVIWFLHHISFSCSLIWLTGPRQSHFSYQQNVNFTYVIFRFEKE